MICKYCEIKQNNGLQRCDSELDIFKKFAHQDKFFLKIE